MNALTVTFCLSVLVYGALAAGTASWTNMGMGSCGKVNRDTELVAAFSPVEYGSSPNPNNAPICRKCAEITATKTGKKVVVNIVDRCVGCKREDVALSPAAFKKLADLGDGRIGITWKYVPCRS